VYNLLSSQHQIKTNMILIIKVFIKVKLKQEVYLDKLQTV